MLFNDGRSGEILGGVGYSQLTIRDGVCETGASAFMDSVADHTGLTRAHRRAGARVALRRRALHGRRGGRRRHRGGKRDRAERGHHGVAQAADAGRHRAGGGARAPLGSPCASTCPASARNLHDHLIAPVIFASPRAIPAVLPGLSHHHAHLFWRSRAGLAVPDTQPLCFHMPMYDDKWMAGPREAYTIHGGLIRTLSRGSLRLRSADPTAPAVMDPRALSAGGDVDALAASVALCREIGRQPALARVDGARALPGPGGAHRRRAARLRAPRDRQLPPPGRHVPDGLRRGRGRGPRAARPRRRGPAGGRRVDHAVGDDRQHERAVDDDRRARGRDDAAGERCFPPASSAPIRSPTGSSIARRCRLARSRARARARAVARRRALARRGPGRRDAARDPRPGARRARHRHRRRDPPRELLQPLRHGAARDRSRAPGHDAQPQRQPDRGARASPARCAATSR